MSIKRIYSSDKNRLYQKDELNLDINSLNNQPPPVTIKMPNTAKNIFKSNGDNIMLNSIFTSPNNNNHFSEKKEQINDIFNLETKINSLEYKLILLEQKNETLMNKLNINEKNFDSKIKGLEKNNFEEKKNIKKTENAINILNKITNDNSNEIKKKISFIHNNIQKEEEYKNIQRKMDIELQNNILNTITSKIKETIKAEIDERFKADMENKALNENIYKNTEGELTKIKKEIEEINNNVINKIKLLSKECSERAHNVSKYTDQQILNAIIGKNEVIDNIKKYMEQFILQVKNNITAQNSQNKLFDERLKEIEKHLEKNKNDNFGYLTEVEKRFDKKMNLLKKYFEINLKKHDNFLDSNIKNFSIAIDKNFNFISNIIIDIRQKENDFLKNMEKNYENKIRTIILDLEKICERIYQYENSLNVFDKQNNLLKKNIADSLTAVKTRLDVHKVNQKILYTIENNLMQEQITYLEKNLESYNLNIISTLNTLKENSDSSISNILQELDKHEKNMEKNVRYTSTMFNRIKNLNEENEVKQVMNELLNNIENINLINSLQNSKISESEINKIIQRQQNDIYILLNDNKINQEKNIELNTQIKKIENKYNTSYNNLEQNINNIIQTQNQAKEIEITEAVNNCMNKMILNIENEITKEKMDDLSKYNLTLMSNSLNDLNTQIKSLNSSTKSNTENIDNIKLSMKSLENNVIKKINSQKNSDLNIKIAMNQMLNNVEFNNIYSLLKNNNKNQNIEFNDDLKKKCGEIVDNKIQVELEKFKIENENIWKKAIEANEKINKPGEIQEIINKVPPTIMPINDSAKRIMDVDYFNGQNENPRLPVLEDKLKLIEDDENNNNNNKNDINDNNKKDDKKEEEDNNKKDENKEEEKDEEEKSENKENEEKESSKNEKESEEKDSKDSKNEKESEEKDSKDSKNEKEEDEGEEEGEGEDEEAKEGEESGEGEDD